MDNDVRTWLIDKLHQWEKVEGERKSEAEFSKYLGVGKEALNHWMNGRNNPSYQSAIKLAEKTGDNTILELLGFELPIDQLLSDEQLAPIANLILQFPEELRPKIQTAIMKALEIMIQSNQVPTEEETLKLVAERILSEIENR